MEAAFLARAKELWAPRTPLIIGVSGGGDSMALMTLLAKVQDVWPAALRPVHVDHGIRPESHDDATWVRAAVRERLGVAVEVVRANVSALPGESMEMAARRVRRTVLLHLSQRAGPKARVVLAHQRQDQAETVLMRVLVGTGVEGLAAMRPRQGRILRPLLAVDREQLRHYLRSKGVPWREDPSNWDRHWLRNRIRLDILPVLKEGVNPRVEEALAALADQAAQVSELVRNTAEAILTEHGVDPLARPIRLPRFATWPGAVRAYVIGQIGRQHRLRLDRRHIAAALEGRAVWPKGWRVEPDQAGGVIVWPPPIPGPGAPAPLPLDVGLWPWGGGVLEVTRRVWADPPARGATVLDAEGWPEAVFRCWQAGDRLQPIGLGGHKKVQDIFVDRKIPRALRRVWPLIASGPQADAKVLAVVGLAVDESARALKGRPAFEVRFSYRTDTYGIM